MYTDALLRRIFFCENDWWGENWITLQNLPSILIFCRSRMLLLGDYSNETVQSIWHDTTPYDTTQHHMTRHDTTQHKKTQNGIIYFFNFLKKKILKKILKKKFFFGNFLKLFGKKFWTIFEEKKIIYLFF